MEGRNDDVCINRMVVVAVIVAVVVAAAVAEPLKVGKG